VTNDCDYQVVLQRAYSNLNASTAWTLEERAVAIESFMARFGFNSNTGDVFVPCGKCEHCAAGVRPEEELIEERKLRREADERHFNALHAQAQAKIGLVGEVGDDDIKF
jgi:hypothetical protein